MMAQARKCRSSCWKLSRRLLLCRQTASAGGGAVSNRIHLRWTNITIDPEAIDPEDIEMPQDMILAAVNDAL